MLRHVCCFKWRVENNKTSIQLPVNNSLVTVLAFVPSINWHVDSVLVLSFYVLEKDLISKIPSRLWSWQHANLLVLYWKWRDLFISICEMNSLKYYCQLAVNPGAQGLAGSLLQWASAGRDWNYNNLHCLLTAIQSSHLLIYIFKAKKKKLTPVEPDFGALYR